MVWMALVALLGLAMWSVGLAGALMKAVLLGRRVYLHLVVRVVHPLSCSDLMSPLPLVITVGTLIGGVLGSGRLGNWVVLSAMRWVLVVVSRVPEGIYLAPM